MSQSDDMGKRQAEAHPASPRPVQKHDHPAEVWRSREEREAIEAPSRADEDVGQDAIDRKGVDAPARELGEDGRGLHAKPLRDNG